MATEPAKLELNPNTLTMILLGIGAVIFLMNGKGCNVPTPPPKPSAAAITPTPAMLSACAGLKSAAASADPAKRARVSAAFADLAFVVAATTGDYEIKTTGRLSDVIQSFGDIIAQSEPDLAGVLPINTSLISARDAAFAALPGTGVDKPITRAQAADFVAAISVSLQ